MVRFGCCLGAEPFFETLEQGLATVHRNGYDYAELRLVSIAELSNRDFEAVRKIVERAPIGVPVFNVFLPRTMPLTGPQVPTKTIKAYLKRSLSRAYNLGGGCVVFGSGRARTVPQGFDRDRAQDQIYDFLKLCEEYASPADITIAIEPLNKKESNIINSVAEALQIAQQLSLAHVKVLADSYHMFQEKEPYESLQRLTGWLEHVHIADGDRYYPGHSESGGVDFAAFFRALKDSGYEGLISTEARFEDFDREGAISRTFVRELWERI
jgi:D-psicose/D-tagatose/L-ribulose 3-epimerase